MENVKEANGRCPFCKKKPFTGFIDKRFERQLNELQVYCIYRPKGCDWVGNFGKIDQHLNIGKENGECQFVVVECPVSVECKEYFLRKNLKNHVRNFCKYRQAHCESVSTYNSLHPRKCTEFPLLCPNKLKCSQQTCPRDQLNAHLALCPEQEVDCTFSEMGCKKKFKRRFLQEHLETNILQHQLMICQAFKEIKKDKQGVEEEFKLLKKGKQEVEEQLELLKKDKKELEVKIQDMLKLSNQEGNQIKSLTHITKTNVKLQSAYFSKMAEFSNVNPVVPIVFKTSFEITLTQQIDHYESGIRNVEHYTAKPYHSQFFYSHSDGYKLQLSAEVICHCSNCRKPQQKVAIAILNQWQRASAHACFVEDTGTVAVNLHIFKGDYDSQLRWPFKEEVTITMYQKDHYDNPKRLGVDKIMDGTEYIPCAVAIFEGNQNHTSTGSKLDIKPVIEKKETDLQPIQLQSQRYDEKIPCDKLQPRSPTLIIIDEGLLLPLDLQKCRESQYNNNWFGCKDAYIETIYFEVTISPQPLK